MFGLSENNRSWLILGDRTFSDKSSGRQWGVSSASFSGLLAEDALLGWGSGLLLRPGVDSGPRWLGAPTRVCTRFSFPEMKVRPLSLPAPAPESELGRGERSLGGRKGYKLQIQSVCNLTPDKKECVSKGCACASSAPKGASSPFLPTPHPHPTSTTLLSRGLVCESPPGQQSPLQ